ncbi:MAG: acetoacetyl-CoA reductase [bacterium]
MARNAIVTGGTRGIGKAICIAMRDAGYNVVANYAGNEEAADRFRQETDLPAVKFDVSNLQECAAAIATLEQEQGPTDILVNNAGITRDVAFHRMEEHQWKDVLHTNLDSLYNVTRPIINGMRDRNFGRIINISSVNGQKGQFGQANYSAAKAGVLGFTRALAQENARKGITVNAIAPGYTKTSMLTGLKPEVLDSIIADIPMGRLGQPEEIGEAVKFLCSDQGGFMTGAVLSINGGQYFAA